MYSLKSKVLFNFDNKTSKRLLVLIVVMFIIKENLKKNSPYKNVSLFEKQKYA